MLLFLDSRTRKITDEKDREISLGTAKVWWKDGKVEDYSQSFQRLANFDFDFDKLDEFYDCCEQTQKKQIG